MTSHICGFPWSHMSEGSGIATLGLYPGALHMAGGQVEGAAVWVETVWQAPCYRAMAWSTLALREGGRDGPRVGKAVRAGWDLLRASRLAPA